MKRFILFGEKVITERKHNEKVDALKAKIKLLIGEIESQEQAYLHLASELEEYKKKVSVRDKRGRFTKKAK